jgi:hypothetical protein
MHLGRGSIGKPLCSQMPGFLAIVGHMTVHCGGTDGKAWHGTLAGLVDVSPLHMLTTPLDEQVEAPEPTKTQLELGYMACCMSGSSLPAMISRVRFPDWGPALIFPNRDVADHSGLRSQISANLAETEVPQYFFHERGQANKESIVWVVRVR